MSEHAEQKLDEPMTACDPNAKPTCYALPRIPLHLWDDYKCGLEKGHAGEHRAISKERLRWHDEPDE